ncbi:MAG: hypothetical protein C3F11_08430 [Methylocystaceae bacterium]|nr:MAG: hypothetical protein C3F11_08430 [Methylocystaceae bacterium]
MEDLIRHVSGPMGIVLRRAYYKRRLKSCGSNLFVAPGVAIENPQFVSVGDWVWIDRNVIILAGAANETERLKIVENPDCIARPGEVVIGSRCHIAIGSVIQGHGGVSIGDSFVGGAGCLIYSLSNSLYSSRLGPIPAIAPQLERIRTPVAVAANVWLGMNSIVIGNTIGDDTFVRPFSTVTADIPANSIASGSPARVERNRYRDEEAEPSESVRKQSH